MQWNEDKSLNHIFVDDFIMRWSYSRGWSYLEALLQVFYMLMHFVFIYVMFCGVC